MGLCVINIASFFYIDKQFENVDYINGLAKVVSIKEEKEYTNKYVVKLLKDSEKNSIPKSNIIIYTKKDINVFPGDIVEIKGEFSKASHNRNFGGFDYNNYLKQLKIYGIVQVQEIRKIAENTSISVFFEKIRMNFLNKIDVLYKKEYSGFLKSLLLGKTDDLSETIEENFRDASISHILAISGMHVSYVIISLKMICDKIIKNKKIKNYFLIFCLIIFCVITGKSVSCVRACIMSGMICFASNFEKKNNFYISFICSWLIIIIYNPYNIYNIGLWLSYMGILGIVVLSQFFKKYFYHKIKGASNKFLSRIIFENFIITISAQILIFPIIMYVFNTISFSFFVSNILISFLIGPVLILGYISIFFSYIKIPFFEIIILIEEVLIRIILWISEVCAQLPFSKIYVTTPKFAYIVFYYLIILFLVYIFNKKKMYILRLLISYDFMKNEVKKILGNAWQKILILKKSNYFYKKYIATAIIICIFFSSNFIIGNEKILEINFVDVGQGDCTYIKTPNGKNIIIDGGEGNTRKYDYGKNVVLPYLLDKGVKKIDYLIATHADSDHIGGLFAIIENLKVENIIIGIQPESSEQYMNLLNISKKKKINILNLKAGDKMKIDEEIFINVLWPIKNKLVEENALNNNSLVFKFVYNDFSCLFTGDIEEIAEKQIVEEYENLDLLKSNILKVAHHGSKTSSIDSFVEEVKPRIALIGVGIDNKFGHPNSEIISKLETMGTRIYRTDKNGEINVYVDNKAKIKVKTIYEKSN